MSIESYFVVGECYKMVLDTSVFHKFFYSRKLTFQKIPGFSSSSMMVGVLLLHLTVILKV